MMMMMMICLTSLFQAKLGLSDGTTQAARTLKDEQPRPVSPLLKGLIVVTEVPLPSHKGACRLGRDTSVRAASISLYVLSCHRVPVHNWGH